MSVEENRAIARKHYEELWNNGRVELLDENYTEGLSPEDYNSIEQHKKRLLWWRQVAPGFAFTILDTVAEGNKVMIWWEVSVTYSHVPDPPPTTPMMPVGKPVKWRGMEIFHFEDGKVIKRDAVTEWASMLVDNGVYVLANPLTV